MLKQLTYLHRIIECLYSDLKHIDNLVLKYNGEKRVETAFTSLNNEAICSSKCCHLLTLIRVPGEKGFNGCDGIPPDRKEMLLKMPDNFHFIRLDELREYILLVIDRNIRQVIDIFQLSALYRIKGSVSKNLLIKKYVDYLVSKYPERTKEDIFFYVADKTEDTFENIRRLYYHKPKKNHNGYKGLITFI
jgi:hypothetical protein